MPTPTNYEHMDCKYWNSRKFSWKLRRVVEVGAGFAMNEEMVDPGMVGCPVVQALMPGWRAFVVNSEMEKPRGCAHCHHLLPGSPHSSE
jgi:hypothetical protein